MLLIEFLQVVFWFNPLFFFFKKSVALNHEFLADASALKDNVSAVKYSQLLFQYSGGAHHTALSSPINYSLTRPPFRRAKKRIVMLSQSFSTKKLVTRLTLLLPVLGCCIYLFNEEIVAKPVKIEEVSVVADPDLILDKNVKEELEKADNSPMFLAKKPAADVLIKKWKKATNVEIWVDGKKVSNTFLAGKTESDFDWYQSNSIENKVTGKIEGYVIKLMTPEYFSEHNKLDRSTLANQVFKANTVSEPSQEIQEFMTLKLRVENESVWVNGESTSVEDFVETINGIIKDWTKSNMMNYTTRVQVKNGDAEVISALSEEFEKTKLYKINPKSLIPPPPPAPAAPTSPIADQLPPPPPPPAPNRNSQETDAKYITLKIEKDEVYLNGKTVKIEKFAETLDAFTKSWTEKELQNATVRIHKSSSSASATMVEQLEMAYKKTAFFKAQPDHGLIPPPPPAFKGGDMPPPPPPVPSAPPSPLTDTIFSPQKLLHPKPPNPDKC
ncbi:MAG: hypothetical protein WBG71_04955 [Leeuwenhoekiella sp.]